MTPSPPTSFKLKLHKPLAPNLATEKYSKVQPKAKLPVPVNKSQKLIKKTDSDPIREDTYESDE